MSSLAATSYSSQLLWGWYPASPGTHPTVGTERLCATWSRCAKSWQRQAPWALKTRNVSEDWRLGLSNAFLKGGSRCVWLKIVDSKPHQAVEMDDQTWGAEHPHLLFSDCNDWIMIYRSKMLRVFALKPQFALSILLETRLFTGKERYSLLSGFGTTHQRTTSRRCFLKLQACKVLGTCSICKFQSRQGGRGNLWLFCEFLATSEHPMRVSLDNVEILEIHTSMWLPFRSMTQW